MEKGNFYELSALIRQMGEFYKTPINDLAMRAYMKVVTPHPETVVADAICALMETSVFMPKPAEIAKWIKEHGPEMFSAEGRALEQFRHMLRRLDTGAEYIFEDPLIPMAIRDAFGGLVSLGRSTLPNEKCEALFLDAYTAADKRYDFEAAPPDDLDHALPGFYHECPRLIYVGRWEVCDGIAHRLFSKGMARFPVREPAGEPLLLPEKHEFTDEERQANLERFTDMLNELCRQLRV